MNRMDVVGFRRLRTLSQLTFESITQIMIQCWILYKLTSTDNEEEKESFGISVSAIGFSLLTAVIHAILEIFLLIPEARAHRTSLLHYASVCLTGTFNWVPFTNLLRDSEEDHPLTEHVFDYDNISTRFCGLDFKYDFYFSEDTLKSLGAHMSLHCHNEKREKRYSIHFGD